MPSLKQVVKKSHAQRYKWPEGWMTLEKAADDLECVTEKVDTILKPSFDDGTVQKQFFQVWDAKQGRVVKKPGYKIVDKGAPVEHAAKHEAKPKPPTHLLDGTRVRTRHGGGIGTVGGGGKSIKWASGRVTTPNIAKLLAKGDLSVV